MREGDGEGGRGKAKREGGKKGRKQGTINTGFVQVLEILESPAKQVIFWQVLEICKFKGKFSDTRKERSQNKLNRVKEIRAKCVKDVLNNKWLVCKIYRSAEKVLEKF